MARGRGRRSGAWKPEDRQFFTGLARAFAGALLFALPMLMTMEMWSIGLYMDPWRLLLLLVLDVPLLIVLSRFGGFKKTAGVMEDIVDAFVALAVAAVMSAAILWLFGVMGTSASPGELLGKIALQTVPASIGAMLARSQLGTGHTTDDTPELSYAVELFLMVVGALFLSLNVAPTEEMILIAFQMEPWKELALVILSVLLMHGFVYSVEFRGQANVPHGASMWGAFLRFTVTGYALVLLVSLYMLWTFGRTDGASAREVLSAVVVLSFPGAIGAAAARLVL